MEGGREGEGHGGREQDISALEKDISTQSPSLHLHPPPPIPLPYLSLQLSLSPPPPLSLSACLAHSLPPRERESLCVRGCLCLCHQMARRLIFAPAVLLILGSTGELDPLPSAPMGVSNQRQHHGSRHANQPQIEARRTWAAANNLGSAASLGAGGVTVPAVGAADAQEDADDVSARTLVGSSCCPASEGVLAFALSDTLSSSPSAPFSAGLLSDRARSLSSLPASRSSSRRASLRTKCPSTTAAITQQAAHGFTSGGANDPRPLPLVPCASDDRATIADQ